MRDIYNGLKIALRGTLIRGLSVREETGTSVFESWTEKGGAIAGPALLLSGME